MFEFVITSNLALDELSKKDKKYKSILTQLKTLLSEINGEFLAFDKSHNKVVESTNEAHSLVKERFNEKIKLFNQNLNNFSKDIDIQISNLDLNFNNEKSDITTETLELTEKIKLVIKQIEQSFNDNKIKASAVRSKDISDISKIIFDIKKQSTQSINQLETAHNIDLQKFISLNELKETDLLSEISAFEIKYQTDKNRINEVKNYYREQSDKKYLTIKNDYHLASTEFNKLLDKLKKEKDSNLSKIIVADEKNRLPIEDAVNELKIKYDQQKFEVEENYKQRLDKHKVIIHTLTTQYNEHKDQLIIAHGDAISLINSKLSSYRDTVASARLDFTSQLKSDTLEATNEDEIKALNRALNKQLRQQENELNRQIIRTDKETSLLLKSHYTKLQDLEIKFLEDKSNWRIDGKKMVIDQKLENFNNEQNYQYQLKSLQLQIKTLKSTNEFEIERAETNHLSKIAPLDLKLSIANATSEKDVNLLSNDTNFHLNHYQHQEDTLTHNFIVYKLQKEHELELLKLSKEHHLSVLNMSLQLSIDKENVIREQQLINQQLKKDFAEYTYQKIVLSEELTFLKQKSLHENDIAHLEKLERGYHHYISEKCIVDQRLLKHKRNLEETNIHYLERSESIDMTNEMMTKDLEVVHSRIHFLFNQLYLIYNIHHHFMLSLIQIYEIPAHPEDVKQFIHLYLDVFNHLNTLQEHAKDQFLVDLNTFQELKINDLTALKLKTDIMLIESEYAAKIKSLDKDIDAKNILINQTEDRVLILSTHVDRIQSELNILDLSDDLKAQATIKKELEKQLNDIESEIDLMDKTIIKFNNQIHILTKHKIKLKQDLDKKTSSTTLKNQNEAKSYLNQKSFYMSSINQISQLFTTYEDKVLLITKKLDQPLYLTNNIIKEYQRGYLRIEDYFEKSSNQLYQSLLKGSLKLFDRLIFQQNASKRDFLIEQKLILKKLHKKHTSLEDKLKNIATTYKHHLQLLSNEKEMMIRNIQTVLFKSKEQEILQVQKTLQSTEDKIMSTETNLKKEMLLIDDNLKSVIEQMHNDFEKHVQKIDGLHEKSILRHNEQLNLKTKNLKTLEESTQLKNNQLSLRFTQTETKLTELNKEKILNFEQTINKKHAALLKKVQAYDLDLKNALIKKDQLISKDDKRLSKFFIKIELHEKKILSKDLKDAKQSYTFKQRTLKF